MPFKLKCQRCGHKWTPRIDDVKRCPRCKSSKWSEGAKLTAEEAVYAVFVSDEMRTLTKMMLRRATNLDRAVHDLENLLTMNEQAVLLRLVREGFVNSVDGSYFLSRRGASLGSMGLKCIIDLGIPLPWEQDLV